MTGSNTYGARTVEKAQQTNSFSNKAPDVIWKHSQASSGQATQSDKAVVRSALQAGYKPKHIGQAISKHSPIAQQSPDASQYGQGLVKEVKKEIDDDKLASKSGKKIEKGQSTEQKREKSASKKTAQQKRQAKPSVKQGKTKQKVRSKARGQGMEM